MMSFLKLGGGRVQCFFYYFCQTKFFQIDIAIGDLVHDVETVFHHY